MLQAETVKASKRTVPYSRIWRIMKRKLGRYSGVPNQPVEIQLLHISKKESKKFEYFTTNTLKMLSKAKVFN